MVQALWLSCILTYRLAQSIMRMSVWFKGLCMCVFPANEVNNGLQSFLRRIILFSEQLANMAIFIFLPFGTGSLCIRELFGISGRWWVWSNGLCTCVFPVNELKIGWTLFGQVFHFSQGNFCKDCQWYRPCGNTPMYLYSSKILKGLSTQFVNGQWWWVTGKDLCLICEVFHSFFPWNIIYNSHNRYHCYYSSAIQENRAWLFCQT